MLRIVRLCLVAVLAVFLLGAVIARAAEVPQTVSQKVAGMERKDGLFPLDWVE